MSKITVVGSINIDLVTPVRRAPRPGETVSGETLRTVPGGKGANQAVCAARLGAEVQMIGRLGEDVFAKELRTALESAGVHTDGLRNVAGPSGCALIAVTDDGQNSIIVVPGANAALQPDALDEHLDQLRGASILLTQLETPLATCTRLGELARQFGIPLMLDPAPAQHLSPELLRTVTWLSPNESETCALLHALGVEWGNDLPDSSLTAAAEHLLSQGVRNVILKLGERGVFLAGQDVPPTRIAPFSVQAVDTTAAGDAFNGGFAYALTRAGMSPVDAARFACAVAAVAVTRPGAQPAMPTLAEVEALLHGA